MALHGGSWAAVRSVLQFTTLLHRGVPGPGPDNYTTTGVYIKFELMGGPLVFAVVPDLRCVGSLHREAYIGVPRSRR